MKVTRGAAVLPALSVAELATLSKAGAAQIAFDGTDLYVSLSGGAYQKITLGSAANARGAYWISTAIETVIAAIDTPTKLLGTSTLVVDPAAVNMTQPVSNRLTYGGPVTIAVLVVVSATITSPTNNQLFRFMLAKGGPLDPAGSPIEASKVDTFKTVGLDAREVTTTQLVTLGTNEFVEAWIENKSSGANATATKLTAAVHAVG